MSPSSRYNPTSETDTPDRQRLVDKKQLIKSRDENITRLKTDNKSKDGSKERIFQRSDWNRFFGVQAWCEANVGRPPKQRRWPMDD